MKKELLLAGLALCAGVARADDTRRDLVVWHASGGKTVNTYWEGLDKPYGQEFRDAWGVPVEQKFRVGCFAVTPPDQLPSRGELAADVEFEASWFGWVDRADQVFELPLFTFRVRWEQDGVQKVAYREVRATTLTRLQKMFTDENGRSWYLAAAPGPLEERVRSVSVPRAADHVVAEVCDVWPGAHVAVRRIGVTTIPHD